MVVTDSSGAGLVIEIVSKNAPKVSVSPCHPPHTQDPNTLLYYTLANATPYIRQKLHEAASEGSFGDGCHWHGQLPPRTLRHQQAKGHAREGHHQTCGRRKVGDLASLASIAHPMYILLSLKRRFQQNQNDCVFTVLSLLPTLGEQILYEMNVEAAWAKLQESRKLEKIEEKRLFQQRAEEEEKQRLEEEAKAAKAAEEQVEAASAEPAEGASTEEETKEEDKDVSEEKSTEETKPDAEKPSEETNQPEKEQPKQHLQPPAVAAMDESVGSLGNSTLTEDSAASPPPPPGILSKKEKYVLWEEIKITSKSICQGRWVRKDRANSQGDT